MPTTARTSIKHAASVDAVRSAAELAKYDLALFECVGMPVAKTAFEQQRVIDYANAGGRVFATHYSYVWLTNSDGTTGSNTGPKPFSQTATWFANQAIADTAIATVDQTAQSDSDTQARRIAFASWLQLVGASTTPGQIAVAAVRHDFDAVSAVAATASGAPAQRWLATGAIPLHYTFDTPVAYPPTRSRRSSAVASCTATFTSPMRPRSARCFPANARPPMTPQEKTLEFMLFDLAACAGPQPGPCVPKTCAEQGYTCGLAGDGCDDGVVLHCGGCPMGQECGQGIDVGTCGTGLCMRARARA